jgi:hypothetical protein
VIDGVIPPETKGGDGQSSAGATPGSEETGS